MEHDWMVKTRRSKLSLKLPNLLHSSRKSSDNKRKKTRGFFLNILEICWKVKSVPTTDPWHAILLNTKIEQYSKWCRTKNRNSFFYKIYQKRRLGFSEHCLRFVPHPLHCVVSRPKCPVTRPPDLSLSSPFPLFLFPFFSHSFYFHSLIHKKRINQLCEEFILASANVVLTAEKAKSKHERNVVVFRAWVLELHLCDNVCTRECCWVFI